jgi:hypothetical protein
METRQILTGMGVVAGVGLATGTVVGAFGAATGAASGAAGAAILTACGYEGHTVELATQMAAAGGALLGAAEGLMAGSAVSALAFFSGYTGSKPDESKKSKGAGCISGVTAYTAHQVIAGMIGYGLFLAGQKASEGFGSYVADVAVGAAVTCIPMGIALCCCFGLGAVAAISTAESIQRLRA